MKALLLAGLAAVVGASPAWGEAPPISQTCAKYPDALAVVDHKSSLSDITKRFQDHEADKATAKLLESLDKVEVADPEYFDSLERMAHALNARERLPSPPVGSLAAKFQALWQAYPSYKQRSDVQARTARTCLHQPGDKAFAAYVKSLEGVLAGLTEASPRLKQLGGFLGNVPILQAGMSSPIAASVSTGDDGQMRICVNPEDVPVQILVTMMHEWQHASNPELTATRKRYIDMAKQKVERQELIKARVAYDIERFYDEIRGYAVEVLTARAVIASAPDYFCRLWVPSFRFGLPFRFATPTSAHERRFKDGTQVAWVAEVYTFETGSYLEESLYVDGDEDKGLKPEVAAKAKQVAASMGL